MLRILFYLLLIVLLIIPATGNAQSEDDLSKNIAKGMAQFRSDIFERKETYNRRLNDIVAKLDTAKINGEVKLTIYEFIQMDVNKGSRSNSMALFDLLPENSPFRSIYIERYITNNQDYQIDRDLIKDLTISGVLTVDRKINPPKIKELILDFNFLGIENDDRILLYNARGAEYAILIGYVYENIDLTIHNRYLDNHYLALDRIDRYPNVNNGKQVEFLQKEDERLLVKGEEWDKIIVRDKSILENSAGSTLNSLHDNLTTKGHLYLLHGVSSDKPQCKGSYKEEKILKILARADFELVDKMEMGCDKYFKFKSVKERE